MTANANLETSMRIENRLVALNPRGMRSIQSVLPSGYVQRAATMIYQRKGVVFIGTGFPVLDTFETDGPLGAIAIYEALDTLGFTPVLVCGRPLSDVLVQRYRVRQLTVGDLSDAKAQASSALSEETPVAIISIERPGLSNEGRYFNMRGEDISAKCACFDEFLIQARCPTVAIGDGGNEIGMGNATAALASLDITPAATPCDELVVADVSNWGGYALVALWGMWAKRDLLAEFDMHGVLAYLSANKSVDGVTRKNTLTEDGMSLDKGDALLADLRRLTGFTDK